MDETKSNQEKNAKISIFEFAELVKKYIYFAYIDEKLHVLDIAQNFYVPVEKKALENFILNRFYNTVVQTGTPKSASACADLLMKLPCGSYYSSDVENILCLQDGYIFLRDLNQARLIQYSTDYLPFYPYRTYTILANAIAGITDWEYARKINCPHMDQFLHSISAGNPLIVQRIWEMIGYLITPTNQKHLFILSGVPNSGKSVLGNFIRGLFPKNQIENLDIDQLGKRTATSRLIGKSVNISMDLPNKALSPLAVRNIKLITGNDSITVEYGNGGYESCHIACRFLFATNHPLTLKGADSAFERRIIFIPFSKSIAPRDQNPNLLQNLFSERDWIVAKALAHYRDLRLNNFQFAGTGFPQFKPNIKYLPTAADDIDAHLCEFVDTECIIGLSSENRTYTSELYNAYREFCSEKSYTPLNQEAAFSRALNKCYGEQIQKARWRSGTENQNGFLGIVLKNAAVFRV